MKKLIAMALLAGAASACRTTSSSMTTVAPNTGNQTGGADATSALRGFLAAAKAQDLQQIGAFFGDADGSARGRIPQDQLEKREIIMASCLKHEQYTIVGDAPAGSGGRTFVVALSKPGKSASINFDVVPASDRRWYVQQFDINKLMGDYCRNS